MPPLTDLTNVVRRRLPLAAACALLALCAFGPVAAHAEWGELGHFNIPAGKGEKEVDFANSSSVLAFATDPADSSYYVGDEPKEAEYRIQRFVEGKEEAAISFTPPVVKKSHGAAGETAVGLQLAVDPARNRVYALVLYKRRSTNENEEKALENEEKALEKEGKKCEPPKLSCWERFPLDSEEQAAGELYAFELVGGQLVPLKESEGKALPIVGETISESSFTAFADQSEQPGEALLNPRGMAVDPTTGDVAIVGVQDEEPDLSVEKEESEKQCRAVAQFVLLESKSGKFSGKLGHRYVDKADALRPGETGCQPEERTEVPLSPVATPGGNLLVYSGAQSEGQIWEVPTPGSGGGGTAVEKLETTPVMIFDEHLVGGLLNMEPPTEGAGPIMSFAPEGPTTGTLYLGVEGFLHEPLPLALSYAESGGSPGQVSEVGWTAGGAGENCGIPAPANVAAVMGAGLKSVLVLDAFLEEGTHSPRVETFAFGPGGSTNGCPKATLTAPQVIFGLDQNAPEVPSYTPVTLSSELKGAGAKSVEWTFKYKNASTHEEGEESTEQTAAQLRNPAGEYEFLPLKYEFKHTGEYEIREVVQGDDLAEEAVKAAEVTHLLVTATPPVLKVKTLPKSVRAQEEEATFGVTVEDPNESEKPTLHLKKVTWSFGDGSATVEEHPGALPNPTELTIKHAFASRCGTKGKCKITMTVEDTAAAGSPATATFEITVTESRAEEKAKKEAEEKVQKEAEEKAQHEKEAKEAQEAKERQEAAERAAREAQAAKEAKEKQEAAEKAAKELKEKQEKEALAHKTPTRAQLLAKALAKCKKGPKSKRAKCDAVALKKYGKKHKKKH